MSPPKKERIESRSQLLTLLSEACELEHGLACSYLYAAFTLKQDLAEGGITWEQLQKIRLWAAQIYLVAAQEMLHLAQAWNLLAAIGGAPYYGRPNFPQSSKYYPLNVPLETEPFGASALRRFILYERPEEVSQERALALTSGELLPDANVQFSSVGELYRLIASGFECIPERVLFTGSPERQAGPELIDFPDLVRVSSRQTALEAIKMITHQGEGLTTDRLDCHFGIFISIKESYQSELDAAKKSGQPFEPVRPSLSNPAAYRDPALGAPGANVISDPYTAAAADLSDSVYGLMLRMLQYVFDNATSHEPLLKQFSRMALQIMTTVVKPIAEALSLLPAGPEYPGKTAGPPFSLTRHVPLPLDPAAARTVAEERLQELIVRLADLARDARAPSQLRHAARNLMSCSHQVRPG